MLELGLFTRVFGDEHGCLIRAVPTLDGEHGRMLFYGMINNGAVREGDDDFLTRPLNSDLADFDAAFDEFCFNHKFVC